MKWHEIGQAENAAIAGGQGLFLGRWTAKKTRYQRDAEEDAWKDTASSYRPSTCIFGTALTALHPDRAHAQRDVGRHRCRALLVQRELPGPGACERPRRDARVQVEPCVSARARGRRRSGRRNPVDCGRAGAAQSRASRSRGSCRRGSGGAGRRRSRRRTRTVRNKRSLSSVSFLTRNGMTSLFTPRQIK